MKLKIQSMKARAGVLGACVAVAAITCAPPARLIAEEAPARPAASTALALQAGSTLVLEGGSTLHDWHSEAGVMRVKASVGGVAVVNGEALRAAVQAGEAVRLEVRIPVENMKSGKEKLDENMYKALEQKTHPDIVYRLDAYEIESAAGDSLRVKTTGRLTVAGTEKPLAMNVSARPEGNGLRVRGSVDFKMTEFNVKPPTMMLGTLRTKNEVRVRFDLVLAAGGSARSSSGE